MTNVAILHPKPDPIGDCERAIAAAIDTLEAQTGQQVSLLDLLHVDSEGRYGTLCGQTHRSVVLALEDGPGLPWVRSFSGEAM